MKKVFGLILFALLSAFSQAQIESVGFVVGAGYTAINIKEAVNLSTLKASDHTAVVIKVEVEYGISNKLLLVGEAGSNRLYYWEYNWSGGNSYGTRSWAEWTRSVGVHLKRYLGRSWYLQAGPDLHIFNDGTGIAPGLVLSSGLISDLSEYITIPVVFRVETIFGAGTPICFIAGAGLNFRWPR